VPKKYKKQKSLSATSCTEMGTMSPLQLLLEAVKDQKSVEKIHKK